MPKYFRRCGEHIQFDCSKGFLERMDALVDKVGAISRAEVFRRAIYAYEMIADAKASATHDILIVNKRTGETRHLVIL